MAAPERRPYGDTTIPLWGSAYNENEDQCERHHRKRADRGQDRPFATVRYPGES